MWTLFSDSESKSDLYSCMLCMIPALSAARKAAVVSDRSSTTDGRSATTTGHMRKADRGTHVRHLYTSHCHLYLYLYVTRRYGLASGWAGYVWIYMIQARAKSPAAAPAIRIAKTKVACAGNTIRYKL